MKLTLEHLCAYFPDGLYLKENCGLRRIMLLRGLNYVPNAGDLAKCDVGNMTTINFYYEEFKPILRHPSCITREIEHRGEKFVPMDRIKDLFKVAWDYSPISGRPGINATGVWVVEIQDWPHKIVKTLHSWMIDTSGLIDAGLAVDVETLDVNPYSK